MSYPENVSLPERIAADGPASNAAEITPSDDNDLTYIPRGLYVGGSGDVAVHMADGSGVIVFAAVPAGSVLPVRVKRVLATDTTATALVALW